MRKRTTEQNNKNFEMPLPVVVCCERCESDVLCPFF